MTGRGSSRWRMSRCRRPAQAERLLPRLGFTGDLEAARTIVSELMTNTVLHGASDGSFLVPRLAPRADGALLVEVVDNSAAAPRPATAGGVGTGPSRDVDCSSSPRWAHGSRGPPWAIAADFSAGAPGLSVQAGD